jgi:four helix bundle protein
VVLNIAEGEGSVGGNARLRYATAFGSARELSAALRLAVAWGYVAESAVQAPESRLDRVRRLLWGLR